MSFEQLLLFGLFALVALAEFVIRRLRRRHRPHGADDAVDGQPPTRPVPSPQSRPTSAPSDRRRLPSPRESPFPDVRPTPPSPSVILTARGPEWARPSVANRTDLRRAIVLMAVLGPPAAQGPDERRGP